MEDLKALTTIEQFAMQMRCASSDMIYDAFEHRISEHLREMIYTYLPPDTSEPVRASLNEIGRVYNVPSLINY